MVVGLVSTWMGDRLGITVALCSIAHSLTEKSCNMHKQYLHERGWKLSSFCWERDHLGLSNTKSGYEWEGYGCQTISHGNAQSRPISEAKQGWAWLVLGWETSIAIAKLHCCNWFSVDFGKVEVKPVLTDTVYMLCYLSILYLGTRPLMREAGRLALVVRQLGEPV